MRRHQPVRVWFKPWQKRCSCGCGWFPCPDSITMDTPGVDPTIQRRNYPQWNAPTARFPVSRNERPLMTPGQEWRTRPGGR
jgi:hypothetical protein